MANKKAPNPIDIHVGGRVRLRRMMIGMSQERLGEQLGITFQQIQKYEKGTNRIGASRLEHISRVLTVPVSFFFEGSPGAKIATAADGGMVQIDTFLSSAEGLALVKAFVAVPDVKVRRRIIALVQTLAGQEPTLAAAA